jgi:hypothetical protein
LLELVVDALELLALFLEINVYPSLARTSSNVHVPVPTPGPNPLDEYPAGKFQM